MSPEDKLSKLFGGSGEDLTSHRLEEVVYPPTIPGRVLHIDGDFLAYQVSADDSKSLDTMMYNHDVAVETLRLLAGAEKAVCHLTASHGNKGRRYDIAVQTEYQACRKGKEKPQHLHTIKSWMERVRGAISHEDQEADDGLCQANHEAIQKGETHLSVLVSKDKDLRMCQGLHLDWDTGTIEEVHGYGYFSLDRSGSSPKIVGKGRAYFWAQMLTGDAADSIQGLPTVPGRVLNVVDPTKAITAALETIKSSCTAKQYDKAQAVLAARQPKRCGAVLAHKLLEYMSDDYRAYTFVSALYKDHGEREGYRHWRTGEEVSWEEAFISDAKLLWMRRVKDENDVLNYFESIKNEELVRQPAA